MVDAQHMRAVMEQYAAAVSAGDEEAILSFYAPEGSCQVPVGGPVHEGIDAVRAFYEGNELAETLVLTGPVRVAGREAAAPMVARVCFDGVDYELDVVDVAVFNDDGLLTSLRAFYSLDDLRAV
ncbi:MAG: nuclear transport factor 2 family protein [Acidimicrobiia bacterium]|nr:nuclear transport factor 2 family protein [Acidimicrobiia bacterium]MCY4432465.1 nuclear transport factor 2 family protein [bacterium]